MVDYKDRPLLGYLPGFMRDIREIYQLMTTEQVEINTLFEELNRLLDNQFLVTADAYGVQRWEKILGIAPRATFTLDERKFTIQTRLNEQLPFSIRRLKEMLSQLCGENGYEVVLYAMEYAIEVKVALVAKNNFADVDALLQSVIPANMIIHLSIKYNQHQTLQAFTHAHLGTYTHEQLRNEVLF